MRVSSKKLSVVVPTRVQVFWNDSSFVPILDKEKMSYNEIVEIVRTSWNKLIPGLCLVHTITNAN
jgi:hypothetical protein